MTLRGIANRLRALRVGDSFVIECTDRRAIQLRLASNIASFKRCGANGWRVFSTKLVGGGVMVARLPDFVPASR
jgi:hypothetical protein